MRGLCESNDGQEEDFVIAKNETIEELRARDGLRARLRGDKNVDAD